MSAATSTQPACHRARVRLTRTGTVNLGDHPTPQAAARAKLRFAAALAGGLTPPAAVTSLMAAGVVPADTLPHWVHAVVRGAGVRYAGRASVGGVRVTTGRTYRDPWACHAAVRSLVRAAARELRSASRDGRRSRYEGVRRVKGKDGAWQARWPLAGDRRQSLGIDTAAKHGTSELAERAAGLKYQQFRAEVRGKGRDPRAVFLEFQRRGLISGKCVWQGEGVAA